MYNVGEIVNTVSPLYTNLQVANFQRCECVFHQCQVWVKLQLALHLLLLMILQLYHLPSSLPPPVSNSSCLFTQCPPLYASCCTVTTVLFKVLYCKMYCTVLKNVFFIFCVCFFMYHLYEKYYKPITVEYNIADCISWVPRLTLLDLGTNWTYEHTFGMELIRM